MKIADDIMYSLFKDEEPDNAIDLLKFDHRNINAMFAQCLKEDEPQQRINLIKEIVEALTLHSAAEEKLVYPILNVEDEPLSQEAYEEHHVMKMSLAEVALLKGTEPNFKAKVKVLSEIVNHHVLEEEAHMLPKVQHSGFDMKDLAEKIRAEKETLKASLNTTTVKAIPNTKTAATPKPKTTSAKVNKKPAQTRPAAKKHQPPKKTPLKSKAKASPAKKRSAA